MQKVDLTQGNVLSVLVALALPVIGGSLLQFGYSLIDMLWVGGLGTDAVASVGSSSFFIGLGYAINALVVVGGGIKISHKIGSGDEQEAKAYTNASLILNTILATLYFLFVFIFNKSLIGFLNLDNIEVANASSVFLRWSAGSMFFIFYNTLFARILSSYGNTKAVFRISAVGAVLNIILDPILIYTLNMGVSGAAIATLIANVIVFIIYLINGWTLVGYNKSVAVKKEHIIEICRLGFPMAFQRVLFTIINILLARIIAMFGSEAIAAQKIGLQIESVMLMIVGGLNGAMTSFTGQNFGAKQLDRMHKGYKVAITMGVAYAICMGGLFWLIPNQLAGLFVDDLLTIAITAGYLRVIGCTLMFAATEMISNGFFSGLGLPKVSATISICFTLMRIPLAMLLIGSFDVYGVWISIAITSALKGVAAMSYYIFKVRRSEIYATQS